MIRQLRWAEGRDRWCRRRRRLLHRWDFQRAWFRELATYYRHLSPEEFWLRYHEGRTEARRRALDQANPSLWTETDYFVLRQSYYHRDRCFHLPSALLPRGGVWLEYGCGIAPVSVWLARHRPDAWGVLADVPGRTWDFAQWRIRSRSARLWCQVLPPLRPLEGRDLSLIICSEVLEHVPDPVATVRTLTRALAPAGHLLVNFVETAAHGANLLGAQRQRSATVAFLAAQLETIRPITPHGLDGIYRKPMR